MRKHMRQALSANSTNEVLVTDYDMKKKALRLHQIEWHRKIALSAACLVLFLIGAPLGSYYSQGRIGDSVDICNCFLYGILFFK